MKNNLKISLIALSTLLTACGGGGSGNSVPNTTLPRAETITAMKTSVDNKSDIIDYVEGHLGKIDVAEYTEEVASKYEAIHKNNPNRSATSNAKVSSQNLTDAEKKYRIAQVKLSYVDELKDVLENLADQSEEVLRENKQKFIDALKLINKNDIVEKLTDDNIKSTFETIGDISGDVEDIKKQATLETFSLATVELSDNKDDQYATTRNIFKYTVKDNKVTGMHYEHNERNNPSDEFDTDLTIDFDINDFKEDKNGFIIGEKNQTESYKYYVYDKDTGLIDFANKISDDNEYDSSDIKDDGVDINYQYKIILGGKSVGLSYSDFGSLYKTILSANRPLSNNPDNNVELPHTETSDVFFGGYKEKLIASKDELVYVLNDNNEISFTGKAIGTASIEGKNALILNGNADLTVSFKDDSLNKNLNLKFDNFYDVNYNNGQITLTGDDIYGDFNKFKEIDFNQRDHFIEDEYYGDMNELEEVVGRLHLRDEIEGTEYMFESVFGAKRK
ncbi:hypothetical protein HDR60_00940 [bacterium]|nr:hypothetical protein [bacterium]